MIKKITLLFWILFCSISISFTQQKWSKDGTALLQVEDGAIIKNQLPGNEKTILITTDQLTPAGQTHPLKIKSFQYSDDESKMLIFTNAQKVWRLETRGDYWVYDFKLKTLKQIGKTRSAASLMFAKISPDGTKAAYVSERNIYLEELNTAKVKALTSTNGTRKLINGTFDWAYEEEFNCRDGFRWSPDSKSIAYWQIDANQIRDFYLINNTDSIYSQIIPIEYPKVGEKPSSCKVGVVDIIKGKTTWMKVDGDPANNYIPRMDWAGSSNELILVQLNRKQTDCKIIVADVKSGNTKTIWEEKDTVWVDLREGASVGSDITPWQWLADKKSFIWQSEQSGWRHLYKINRDGTEKDLTKGNYDVISHVGTDEANGFIYFYASPKNACQQYLYRTKLDGSSSIPELLNAADQKGTHYYSFSSTAKFATHVFSNSATPPMREWVAFPDNESLNPDRSIAKQLKSAKLKSNPPQFFQVTTGDGVTMDGWMVKPTHFDSTKQYPVLFYVYSEPASATVKDVYGTGELARYNGNLADDGYIYMSIDGRGTPAPKGKEWRKAIYRKIGQINIRDQAMATKEILKWPFIDADRIAVWGWSGGGSATLNLLFQYPEIYKTGIAGAAVVNQLTYDNIYQERYMGLPQENKQDFIDGSPLTYAKNLQGNLLYIHGTGDDNVHYQNGELLINELVKYNKLFQVMPYPNRTHGAANEGGGVKEHMSHLFTQYLRDHCAPGGIIKKA